jgi:hypothetical protein
MNMNRPWLIYILADPRTGEVRYVGVTFRKRQRFNEHISTASNGGKTHRDCWIRSLLALSLRPEYRVIQIGSGEGWQQAERDWIAHYRPSGRLVNITDGGEGLPGYIPTEELRRKWSQMRKGVKYAPGRTPAMLGKRHSPEAREKIREAGAGRKQPESARAKISAARRGKPLSAEHRTLLSEAHRGKILTETHKRKIADSTTGRKPVLCVETGEVYPSITGAAKVLDVTEASVGQAIRKGCRCRGNHFRFA